MKLFHRNRSESSDPAGNEPNSDPLSGQDEVFVYEDDASASGQLASSIEPQVAPPSSTAEPVEVQPTARNYVESLRAHGGSRAVPQDQPVQSSQSSSQGEPAMASGNYNGKFITIPYSLLPSRGNSNSDAGASQASQSRSASQEANSAGKNPPIDEAVITAVEQQVRNNVMAATHQEMKNERERVQAVALEIRNATSSQSVMQAAVSKTREVLQADRVMILRCAADDQGKVKAESLGGGWTPGQGESLPLSLMGGETRKDYESGQVFAFNRSQPIDFTPYQLQLLERFQVKASLTLPIVMNDDVWGLLVVHQCGQYRQWRESEIDLAYHVVTELRLKLQATEFRAEVSQYQEQENLVNGIVNRIRETLDVEKVFKTTTQEIRRFMQCDRVVVYRFNDDWTGEFIAESVGSRLHSILGKGFSAEMGNCDSLTSLRPDGTPMDSRDVRIAQVSIENGRDYNRSGFFLDDVLAYDLPRDFLDAMEEIGARAYLMSGIFVDNKIWGMLALYHTSPMPWKDKDRQIVAQIATQCGVALKQSRYVQQLKAQSEQIQQSSLRQNAVAELIGRIRQNSETAGVFKSTTQEVRRLLDCDRVVMYRFNEDWSGEFIAESAANNLKSILGQGFSAEMGNCHSLTSLRPGGMPMDSRDVRIADVSIKNGRDYNRSGFFLDDVRAYNLPADFLAAMEDIGTRAYMMTAVFVGDKLWGMLAAYHGTVRPWGDEDRQLLAQIATQCGVALQQAEYVAQLQNQTKKLAESAERERSVGNLINRIRENQKAESVFRTATQEVRRLLDCDRTIIYRFNEDWSGEVMAESVGAGWMPLLQMQAQDKSLKEELMASDNCVVKYYGDNSNSEGDLFKQDTYLRDTKGGEYTKGSRFRQVDDVAAMNFAPCYQQTLEKFECKAYINVPIFQGSKLWGLMAAYQNDGPREWEEADVNLLMQIAPQMGLTLQQVEYLEKLEAQSAELRASAEREKAANSEMQMKVVNLLRAVRPALDGDLTVRAPITEDAVGTVADSYNNTIQSLRQIVTQVKQTATKVSSTSETSSLAIAQLSEQSHTETQAVQQALAEIQSMRNATDAVATNANKVEAAVQQANQVVKQGDSAMDRTVDGIMAIRSTVSETSKKIKRLSESSQKISRVVSLIGDFTTQTQLLALNAAIEATRAGEYGRGFAVVADEVRSLARQSAEATTEIEKLVQEIQAETSAVTQAMDTGIDQVVSGTNLVNETRESLTEIVSATAKISDFVQGITDSATTQTEQFQSVEATMNGVTELATKSSEDSLEISESFKELLATAKSLQSTVGKFKV